MSIARHLIAVRWGVALLVPMLATLAALWGTEVARSAEPPDTNAVIATCVETERKGGRNGLACIGRFMLPCKARPDNAHKDDQMECDEREYVLWNRLMLRELRALRGLLDKKKKAKLQRTQELWDKCHASNYPLP